MPEPPRYTPEQLSILLRVAAGKLGRDPVKLQQELQSGSLEKGVYQFGMLAQDRCSRQRLVNFSSWVIEI